MSLRLSIRTRPTALNRAYFANRLLSQTGQGLFMAAVVVLAGTEGSAAIGLGSVMVAMMAGSILFGLPGSATADRIGPGLALVLGIVARTGCILATLVVPANPYMLGAVAFVYSSASQLMCPAELALVAAVAGGRPAKVHGVLVVLQHAGYALGAILAAPVLYIAGGTVFMLAGAASLYMVATAVSLFIYSRVPHPGASATTRHAFSFRQTARYFIHRPVAGRAAVTLAFAEVSAKALVISLPAYIAHDLGLDAPLHYFLAVPAGLGAVSGLFWTSRFFQLNDAGGVLRAVLLGTVVSLVALSGLGAAFSQVAEVANSGIAASVASTERLSIVVAVPVAILLGACYAITPVAARGVLSATAPAGQQARVFGLQATFTDILCVVPLALSGVSTEVMGARSTFLLIGFFGICMFAVLEAHGSLRRQRTEIPPRALPAPATLRSDV